MGLNILMHKGSCKELTNCHKDIRKVVQPVSPVTQPNKDNLWYFGRGCGYTTGLLTTGQTLAKDNYKKTICH